MEILEYGNPQNKKIILIHGFESPYQIWNDYIDFFKDSYYVIVPILPGHNVNEDEEFISFDQCVKELEDHYIHKFKTEVHTIYGMSMGGVFACYLWQNQRLKISHLILESSPLLSYGKFMTSVLTKQYLSITDKARKRDKKTVQQAIGSMITEDKLDIFLELLDHISDTTITNYIKAIGQFKLSDHMNTPYTRIHYLYGGKINEILFKKVAKFIKKNYPHSNIICFSNKGHCEDALIHPQNHIKVINDLISKEDNNESMIHDI